MRRSRIALLLPGFRSAAEEGSAERRTVNGRTDTTFSGRKFLQTPSKSRHFSLLQPAPDPARALVIAGSIPSISSSSPSAHAPRRRQRNDDARSGNTSRDHQVYICLCVDRTVTFETASLLTPSSLPVFAHRVGVRQQSIREIRASRWPQSPRPVPASLPQERERLFVEQHEDMAK